MGKDGAGMCVEQNGGWKAPHSSSLSKWANRGLGWAMKPNQAASRGPREKPMKRIGKRRKSGGL